MNGLDLVSNINKVLDKKGVNKTQMLQSLKIPKSSMNNWESNGNIPSGDKLFAIAQYLNVSMEWLITGQEAKNDISQEDKELLENYHQLSPDNQSVIQVTMQAMLQNQQGKSAAIVG